MAHQQTNLIVSDFNQILQINISDELLFFLTVLFCFSVINYYHFYRQYGD